MSNRTSAPQPATSTDRPTATYPTATYPTGYLHQLPEGWEVDPRPSRYLDPTDPRLVRSDATPTGVFPTRPVARPDAASTARTRPHTRSCHTLPAPSTETGQETPLQDMWRPGILARPSMRWHPSLMQLAIGAALVLAIIGACNVAAIQAHRAARAHCHALAVSDWARAQRECRGTGSGTPVPEQAPQPPAPRQAPQQAPQPEWVTRDTHAAYDRTDPLASPLDLPRCTTAPDTPMPCLAHVSADSRHAVVLEEDASLTALDRR